MEELSLLRKEHRVEPFDSDNQALNIFLKMHALQSQANNISRTYILSEKDKIIGYYSLMYGSVSFKKYQKESSKEEETIIYPS